jgi:hypothetical protein
MAKLRSKSTHHPFCLSLCLPAFLPAILNLDPIFVTPYLLYSRNRDLAFVHHTCSGPENKTLSCSWPYVCVCVCVSGEFMGWGQGCMTNDLFNVAGHKHEATNVDSIHVPACKGLMGKGEG